MTQTLTRFPLLQGIPNDRTAKILGMQGSTQANLMIPGSAIFANHLSPAELERLYRVVVSPDKPMQLRVQDQGRPLINYVADADLCSRSLAVIDSVVAQSGGPCFNHPARIRETGRQQVSRRLAAMPELQVPRTELVAAQDATDLAAKIEQLGLSYPLIMRVPGTHAGDATALVQSADEIPRAVYALPVGGKPLYLTEFVDCRDPDGLFRKLRLVVIGRQVFARHFIAGAQWNVHVADRLASEVEVESAFVDEFPDSLPMDAAGIALAIADLLELDFFGIDCCPRADGRLLIFEVNASMDILRDSFPEDPRWAPRLSRIRHALLDLLFDPSRWRHQGRLDPAATTTA